MTDTRAPSLSHAELLRLLVEQAVRDQSNATWDDENMFAFARAVLAAHEAKVLAAHESTRAPAESEAIAQLRHLLDDLLFKYPAADGHTRYLIGAGKGLMFDNFAAACERLIVALPLGDEGGTEEGVR